MLEDEEDEESWDELRYIPDSSDEDSISASPPSLEPPCDHLLSLRAILEEHSCEGAGAVPRGPTKLLEDIYLGNMHDAEARL